MWIILVPVVFYLAVFVFLIVRERAVASFVPDHSYEAIVVLGAQVKSDGEPSVQLSWRLDAAAEAYRKHPVPIVVCGAQGADEPEPEALVMKRYLADKGIPEQDIFTDPDSFNTKQNLMHARQILSGTESVETVLIVTSDYHVPRALALAEDLGMKAEGLGSPCKSEYWIKNHFRETLAWIKYLGMKLLRIGQ